jgi:hypothetical protein
MKRLLLAFTCLLTLGVGTAQAIPGPDPNDGHSTFSLEMFIHGKGATDVTSFNEASGWDFGDRAAYRCAWVEFFQSGSELFEVQYHAVSDYPDGTIEINDRYGEELPDPEINDTCWDADSQSNFVHDGSDHFPHGTSLVFRDAGTNAEIARIDYSNQCTKLYWTPGNQAGEAWLWWDEDGPEDKIDHGDGLCGGGPEEPDAIVQARVRSLASGVEACVTDAMDGDLCFTGSGTPSSVHKSRVTMRLSGQIRATGVVRVPDGVKECRRGRVVVIERRASNGWKKVGRDRTSETGRYAEHIRAREGVYRARVPEATLAAGDTCQAATSRMRSFGT